MEPLKTTSGTLIFYPTFHYPKEKHRLTKVSGSEPGAHWKLTVFFFP